MKIERKEVVIRGEKFVIREPLFKDFMEAYRKAGEDQHKFNVILLSKCIEEPKLSEEEILNLPAFAVTKLIMELSKLMVLDEGSRKNLFTVLGAEK